jgi:Bacterial Ig domain
MQLIALLARWCYALMRVFLGWRCTMGMARITIVSAALSLTAAMSVLQVQVASAQPPTTTVLIPSNNATVSGTSQVLDAVASSGATQVQYEITGGTLTDSVIATGTATIYGWLAQWNTTSVANGSYTLQSVASYSGGSSVTSPSVTITVNNQPPTTTVLIPSSGARLDDTANNIVFDAVASPGVTGVNFSICGILLVGTPTIYGWVGVLAKGSTVGTRVTLPCMVQSTAYYPGGVYGSSSPVAVTLIVYVNTQPPP